MVAQGPLEPLIMVRIHAGQPNASMNPYGYKSSAERYVPRGPGRVL